MDSNFKQLTTAGTQCKIESIECDQNSDHNLAAVIPKIFTEKTAPKQAAAFYALFLLE